MPIFRTAPVQAIVTIYPFQGQPLGEGFSNFGNPVIAVVGDQNARMQVGSRPSHGPQPMPRR